MSFTDAEIFEAFAESASYVPARRRGENYHYYATVLDHAVLLLRAIRNARWRDWFHRNPKKKRASNIAWAKANRPAKRAINRRYDKSEKGRARRARYRAANKVKP